ncbi:MAG: hypothetical protein EOO16_20430 [Chitinophagaceae bacterium]|nr:MAG: hypothetical protein EOO16_20430 [Chitinophagaceae bacterium]
MRLVKPLLFLCFLAGCAAATHISSAWQKPGAAPFQPGKLVVFCMTPGKDSTMRFEMEEELAGKLRQSGIPAWTSGSLYARNRFAGSSWDSAYQILRADSVDAVVVVALRGEERSVYPLPQRVETYQRQRLEGYVHQAQQEVAVPATVTNTRHLWECNTYNLLTRELLSTLQTESYGQGPMRELTTENGRIIAGHLAAAGIFRKP